MRTRARGIITTLAAVVFASMLTFAGVSVAPAGAATKGSGGNATFAELVGEPPTYCFPMFPISYWTNGYVEWCSYLAWPGLYLWGKNGKTVFNATRSLADAPVFSTNSTGDTVATITMKTRYWSNGQPVTTRDVEFWMNLLDANKTTFGPYTPGKFPTIVKQINYISSSKFQITFDGKYSSFWLLGNELSDITPIPQQAWDKTSVSGPVGNYDMTPSGAKSVLKFLQSQAKSATTLGTNPLWKVVDGAWEIKSFNATTGSISFAPNPKYPWPQPHRLSQFTELAYTSTTAELNALESGSLDVGYVPLTSLKAIPHLESEGYKIVTWDIPAFGGLLLDYAKDSRSTPIFNQLYFRQALTHMIDMKQIIQKIYHGRASYASGGVGNPNGHGQYLTSLGKSDPYPYNVAAAKNLLSRHGWHVVPNGVTTCAKPGTAPDECGRGIPKGAKLRFKIVGTQSSQTSYEVLQYIISQFSAIGVSLETKIVPESEMISDATSCSTTCNWNMELWITGEWILGDTNFVPVDTAWVGCGSSSNYLDLCNAENSNLVSAITTSSDPVAALKKWENFMAKQQFQIMLPIPAVRVVAYKKNLHGVTPLTPYLNIYPQDWYFSK